MPSLWKKVKGNRISRLVSDLQSPPTRGGSLVVETGFPTSLVDLFVKNRDRLRKPSKKKRSKSVVVDPPPSPPPAPRSSPSSSPPPTSTPATLPFPSRHTSFGSGYSMSERIGPRCSIDEEKEEIVVQESDLSSLSGKNVEDREIVPVPDASKRVFVSVLKAALVVILALCSKKLVLGLTMAAFLLLLIEYVGACVVGLLKPCKNARVRWKSLFFWVNIERDKGMGVSRGLAEQGDNNCKNLSYSDPLDQKKVSSCPIEDEIQVVDANSDVDGGFDEVSSSHAKIDLKNSYERLKFVEMEVKRLVLEEEERRVEICRIGSEVSRDGRAKKGNSFWKKLVSKKLNCGKKKRNRNAKQCESVSSSNKPKWEDEDDEEEEEEEEQDQEERDVTDEEGSFSPPQREGRGRELVEKIEQFNGDEKEVRKVIKRTNGSLKYLFIVMIVLAGLVRGKLVALVLTVMCLLIFKMARTATGNVPPIKVSS